MMSQLLTAPPPSRTFKIWFSRMFRWLTYICSRSRGSCTIFPWPGQMTFRFGSASSRSSDFR
ncbi:hypothetical protein [Candidatus Amarobacter glycogenicus]|uniref:hypothetical protein n=1 Tax=Candidatus Amarobacter glycogenicus TaxID=3140699 RepID=UPI0031CC89BE